MCILAIASSALSGQPRVATGDGRGDLPSPRPSWLESTQYSDTYAEFKRNWLTFDIVEAADYTDMWRSGYYMRYVYWTGYAILYSKWYYRGWQTPWGGEDSYAV